MENVTDLVVIIVAGLVGGMLARAFKQPLILGYILAGIIVGPNTGGYQVLDNEIVGDLAEIGVALLLFSLGIEFSIKNLKPIRHIAGIGALIQVALTLGFGYLLGLFFGWSKLASFCLGISIVSSSTAVILKSLVSTGHQGSLSGRVMLGLSIVQDMTVIPLMIVMTSLTNSEGGLLPVFKPILIAVAFVGVMIFLGTTIMPWVLRKIASWNSQELFLLSVTSIALGIGYVSHILGLSFSFGAFIAGLVLAGSDYGHKALSEMIPVRDVFSLLFFVSIGMLIAPQTIMENLKTVVPLVVIACIGRGVILSGLSYSFGYRNVIPLAVFLGMIPISEIGFVVIQTARSANIINDNVYACILNSIVISMIIGPILSGFTGPIYGHLKKYSRKEMLRTINLPSTKLEGHVIIAGGGHLARYIGKVLNSLGLPYVVIEPNHALYLDGQKDGLVSIFGDPRLESVLHAAGISDAKLLIITSKSFVDIVGILQTARAQQPEIRIISQFEGEEGLEVLRKYDIYEVVRPENEVGIEMLRQALLSMNISSMETHHYLDEVRENLYTPMDSDDTNQRLLSRLRLTMGLMELDWAVLPEKSHFAGKSLAETNLRAETGISIVGVMRNKQFHSNPPAVFVLEAGDHLAVMGTSEQMKIFLETMDDDLENLPEVEPILNPHNTDPTSSNDGN